MKRIYAMIAALIRGLFTRGNKWTHSNDRISEVISHFVRVQSNCVDLEGTCQSMVYRSLATSFLFRFII